MIVVFGRNGMLGKAVTEELVKQEKKFSALTRQECDILRPEDLKAVQREIKPSVIINCAGDPNGGGRVNSLGPWYLARIFPPATVIHVSTDCVFDNWDKFNNIGVVPSLCSPESGNEYQVSKMLGEQRGQYVVNVRTSFIGYDHGLLKWLLEQKPGSTIQGWDHAFWSGSSVYEVARQLVVMAGTGATGNIEHLATERITTKYDVLKLLIEAFKLDLKLEHSTTPAILRGLVPSRIMAGLDNEFVMKELVNARPN